MHGDRDDDLAVVRATPLVTGRYQAWTPDQGVAIRSTVGAPRFWRHGPLILLRLLAPYGIFGKALPPDEAGRRYLARLDRHAEEIVAALADLARSHAGQQLVVLCFENVHAGESCHRRWFAEWFEERHGIEVPELIDVDQPQLPL